jgi:hypothetical protein
MHMLLGSILFILMLNFVYFDPLILLVIALLSVDTCSAIWLIPVRSPVQLQAVLVTD